MSEPYFLSVDADGNLSPGLRALLAAQIGSGPPSPIDLGTLHLDTVREPMDYTQIFLSRATKAQGYPLEGIAGTLTVRLWNPANGALIQVYTPWTTDPVCKRTYYQGTWRPWVNMLGHPPETTYPTKAEHDALAARVAALEAA